jgi:AMMECR1 domain-containing protein
VRFPLPVLGRPLRSAERLRIDRATRALLRWQATLTSWPRERVRLRATPFVSIYLDGRLRGCFGSREGLARAFAHAASDIRFGGMAQADRARATAQVSVLREVRRVEPGRIAVEIEMGRDGLALVDALDRAIVLLPSVARDGAHDADGFVRAMADKSGVPFADWSQAGCFLIRTEEVVVRPAAAADRTGGETCDPRDAAAAFLVRQIDARGRVAFARDARSGSILEPGVMHHGRVAVGLRALREHGGHARACKRALERLERDVRDALDGRPVPGWPERPEVVAGSLALVALAGVDVRRELSEHTAARAEVTKHPWYAAQVVAALGCEAPPALWEACVSDLDAHPWAPWTAIAARALGDSRVLARTSTTLASSIRRAPPHTGGCGVRPIPEIALTAVVVEALAASPRARHAVERARDFLRAWQHMPPAIRAPLLGDAARGGFPVSPVADLLRIDVTGHALLALF